MSHTDESGSTRRYAPVAIALCALAGMTAAIVVLTRAPEPPAATPVAAPVATASPIVAEPEPPVADSGEPIFGDWLRYEPKETQADPNAARRYIDNILGHRIFQIPPSGIPPMQAQALLLEDDDLLLSSGRRLWTRELDIQPGFRGKICYVHSSYCLPVLFETSFFVDGKPAIVYADQYRIDRFPSHTLTTYFFEGVRVEERKFITWDDRAVAAYTVASTDNKAHDLAIEAVAPYPPVPRSSRRAAFPLLGTGNFQGQPLYIYFDAPGFEQVPASSAFVRKTIRTAPNGNPSAAHLAVSFATEERAPGPPPLAADVFVRHQADYNQWFADNVPYFDSSDPGFKKMWYYRWWIVRFNMNEFDAPDLKSYSFYEGKLGFDNVISFAVPVQLKELAYLRDRKFAISQARNSYSNRGDVGAVIDPPGSPYWGEMYSHWISAALAELHRVHPLTQEELLELLPHAAQDVTAWTTAFDQDHDSLPERLKPRLTGYDLDILSFWYFNGTKFDPTARLTPMERADFAAFVYANARGVAELARAAGDEPLAKANDEIADRIRTAVLAKLWDPKSQFFYPQRSEDDARAPIRELHGFFPFTALLPPDEPRYTAALAKFIDPEEFWTRYPPVITSSHHYRSWNWEMDGLTRNIAPHPITMGARTLIQAFKHYRTSPIRAEHFMELMERYNELVYPGVHPYDPYWRPNAHEYFSKWEPNQSVDHPKPSDISHDFHSAFCYLVIEGAVGLTPRTDESIEINPAARKWDHFLLDRLRYREHDLTIAWDRPDGQVRYAGIPEGFSLYIDGQLQFTDPELSHVVWDPAKKAKVNDR